MYRFSFFFGFLFFVFLLSTAAAGSRALETQAVSVKVSQGEVLYEEHCARCHGELSKTTKPQRRLGRLRSSIQQFPAMNKLAFLTDEQLAAIASVLETASLH